MRMLTETLQRDSSLPSAGSFADAAVRWRVWAPHADDVRLVLFDDQGFVRDVPMIREPSGFFVYEAPGVLEGQRYGYRLDSGLVRPDPASRWQPDGVHRPSAVLCPERFDWEDEGWRGVPREDLVIYELHVGTFTRAGTFDALIPRLETLRDLGITAIELMPIAQFPGDRGWGYDGVFPYAVQNSYGGPHGLQRLVNACHRVGLAVILDMVYNHLGPEGNCFGEFGPYFSELQRTPWGQAFNFDESGCDAVRAFLLDNVRYWVREFHVDGLRLDAVHAISDSSAHHILRQIKEAAAEAAEQRGWSVYVFAESNLNDVRLLDPPDTGCGLDAAWNDDFHHAIHALLTGERHGYYVDYGQPEHLVEALNRTFVYNGRYSAYRGHRYGTEVGDRPGDRFIVSIQNHDQVGNRARGDRFGTLLNSAQQRLATGLLLLSPHVPLLFMGEEYGETRPFPFFCSFSCPELVEAVRLGRRQEFSRFAWQGEVPDPQAQSTFESAKLSWFWLEGSCGSGLRRLYRDLLSVRRRWPALRDFKHRSATFVDTGGSSMILRLVRGGKVPEDTDALVVYFNLSKKEQPLHDTRLPVLRRLLSSEMSRYVGRHTETSPWGVLLPYEFQVFGPSSWESP